MADSKVMQCSYQKRARTNKQTQFCYFEYRNHKLFNYIYKYFLIDITDLRILRILIIEAYVNVNMNINSRPKQRYALNIF